MPIAVRNHGHLGPLIAILSFSSPQSLMRQKEQPSPTSARSLELERRSILITRCSGRYGADTKAGGSEHPAEYPPVGNLPFYLPSGIADFTAATRIRPCNRILIWHKCRECRRPCRRNMPQRCRGAGSSRPPIRNTLPKEEQKPSRLQGTAKTRNVDAKISSGFERT